MSGGLEREDRHLGTVRNRTLGVVTSAAGEFQPSDLTKYEFFAMRMKGALWILGSSCSIKLPPTFVVSHDMVAAYNRHKRAVMDGGCDAEAIEDYTCNDIARDGDCNPCTVWAAVQWLVEVAELNR